MTGGYCFVSGMIGAPHGPDAQVRAPAATLSEQADLALGHLAAVTRAAGASVDRVVEVSGFVVPPDGEPVVRERVANFLGRVPPLVQITPVADVAMHGLLELDWIVSLDPMADLDAAAEPFRSFGHGGGSVRSGPFLAINGLTASGESLGEQTRRLFDAAAAQLRQHGSGLDRLVKLSVFIAAFDRYPEFNEATKERFATVIPPARSVVVAPAITGDALLRVDLLALAGRPNP
jgi:2-iminobutanoate/2-iminopropanoate deaminase